MAEKNIHKDHRKRMRERFLKTESLGFAEHELLEMLMFYSIPVANTNKTAHLLIEKFGNIESVLSASPSELMKVDGVGKSTTDFLKAFSDVCNCYLETSKPQAVFETLTDARIYLRDYFRGSTSDACVFMNIGSDMNLIDITSLSYRDMADEKISAREISEILIRQNFYRMIIGICKPRSSPVPNDSDYALMKRIFEIAKSIEIKVDDLIICGKNGKTYSMFSHGAFSFNRSFDF